MKRAPKDVVLRKRLREEEWQKNNSERVSETKRRWWEKNRERVNAERRGNQETLAYAKQYRQTSAGKAAKKRMKSKERGAALATLTALDWHKILKHFNKRCAYCQSEHLPVEQEHKTPLSRGGNHDKNNVVPSCRRCNLVKGTRTVEEWLNDIKRALTDH